MDGLQFCHVRAVGKKIYLAYHKKIQVLPYIDKLRKKHKYAEEKPYLKQKNHKIAEDSVYCAVVCLVDCARDEPYDHVEKSDAHDRCRYAEFYGRFCSACHPVAYQRKKKQYKIERYANNIVRKRAEEQRKDFLEPHENGERKNLA